MIRILGRAFASASNRATVILKGRQPNGAMRIERAAKILENAADISQSSAMYLHHKSDTMISAVEVSYNSPAVVGALVYQINNADPGKLEAQLFAQEQLPEPPLLKSFHSKCFSELMDPKEFLQILPINNGRQFVPIDSQMNMVHLKVKMQNPAKILSDNLLACTREIAADDAARFILVEDALASAATQVTDTTRMVAQVFAQCKYDLGNKALGLVTSNAEFAYDALLELGYDVIADCSSGIADPEMLDILGRTGKTFCIQYSGNEHSKQSIQDHFNETLSRGSRNRVYKWNVMFSYGEKDFSNSEEIIESLRLAVFSPAVVSAPFSKGKHHIRKHIKEVTI